VLTYARHSELSRNVPPLLVPFSHKKDPKLDSENTPSRSDTPSIRSYLLTTKETLAHTNQLLDYLATQEDGVLTYNRSEMIMAVHSDASYLCKPKAKSRAGGNFFMSTNAEIPPTTAQSST
jgi:hypothetical protein